MIFEYLNFETIVKNRALEPFYFDKPWSIPERQNCFDSTRFYTIYKMSTSAHRNTILNRTFFRLSRQEVQIPQALGGKTPHGSYMETLSFVKRKIDAEGPFDVAIVAAGAYAMPLVVYCKLKQCDGNHKGGGSQLLFGLKGHR